MNDLQSEIQDYFVKKYGEYVKADERGIVEISFNELNDYPTLLNTILEIPDNALEEIREYIKTNSNDTDNPYISFTDIPQEHFKKVKTINAKLANRMVAFETILSDVSTTKDIALKLVYYHDRCNEVKTISNSVADAFQAQLNNTKSAIKTQPKCTCDVKMSLDPINTRWESFLLARCQELPEDTIPGNIPHSIELYIPTRIMEKKGVKAGMRVKVVGVVRIEYDKKMEGKFAGVFNIRVDVSSIVPSHSALSSVVAMTDEDETKIRDWKANMPNHIDALVDLFVPRIKGMRHIKKALLYFVTANKENPNINLERYTIHMLIIGDPSLSKSGILKYAVKLIDGFYSNAIQSTGRGITASTPSTDKNNGARMLSIGPAILANGNVCAIDEFANMSEDDRNHLNEIMEQQTCTINKSGFVNVQLIAKTAILAACNPHNGRYDPDKDLSDNVNFNHIILSRFGLIYVVRDVIDEENDTALSKQILEEIAKPKVDDVIDPLLLRYISLARSINPIFTEEAYQELRSFWVEIRKFQKGGKALPITIRQLHDLVRLAIASARLDLSDRIEVRHAMEAVQIYKEMFKTIGIDVDKAPDMAIVNTGMGSNKINKQEKMWEILKQLTDNGKHYVKKLFLENTFRQQGYRDTDITSFLNKGVDMGKIMPRGYDVEYLGGSQ